MVTLWRHLNHDDKLDDNLDDKLDDNATLNLIVMMINQVVLAITDDSITTTPQGVTHSTINQSLTSHNKLIDDTEHTDMSHRQYNTWHTWLPVYLNQYINKQLSNQLEAVAVFVCVCGVVECG